MSSIGKVVCGVILFDDEFCELEVNLTTGIVTYLDGVSGIMEVSGLRVSNPMAIVSLLSLKEVIINKEYGEDSIGIILHEDGYYIITEREAKLIPFGSTEPTDFIEIDLNVESDDNDLLDDEDDYEDD